jgi:hypothetical protein
MTLRGATGISVGSNDCFATGSEELNGEAERVKKNSGHINREY